MPDLYHIIAKEGSGVFKEKMSKFLSFAFYVENSEEAKSKIREYQNLYHDARHVCWAYMIGPERKEWQLNDNGEPSGTAGKPIIGQINSLDITNVVVIVVRYFGGIKLGTPGLISAYREAARLALEDAGKKEVHKMERIRLRFPYVSSNEVMKIVKSEEVEVLDREFDNSCEMTLAMREDFSPRIKGMLEKVSGLSFVPFQET
ncbi:MAG: YigZ family protein [Muribaculaceae bacterium]|nr:YigZ family protein [Muribaculaceae bacterium]